MKAVFATILFLPMTGFAQANLPKVSCLPSKAPLFQSNSTVEISMKGKFPVYETAPAEIKYVDRARNVEKSIPITVSRRGKSRGGTCDFKPIRIGWDEKKKDLKNDTIFSNTKGQDMKLTAHCRYTMGTIKENQETNEVIIKEYMVYKMLKAFGLPAFDVRLAKIQYLDDNNRLTVEGMGFFIESSAQLGQRCGLDHVKEIDANAALGPNLNKQLFVSYLYSRLISDARDFVVQYASGGHNSEAFFDINKVTQVIVPYDFNDSGQVNSGVAPFWSFSPNMDYWFNELRAGPFTRDGQRDSLTEEERKLWKANVVEQAKQLILKKQDVMRAIDESPLQQATKNQFHNHVDALVEQFQKIVKDGATVKEGLPRPSGVW